MQRIVVTYKRYFLDFYDEQVSEVQTKIEWTLTLIATIPAVPIKYLKHIEGTKGLYEIRVEVNSNIFRIFCFFYEGNIIVLGNAFQKKTEKIPKSEITKALKIMEEYKNENNKK
jgi:phage-related protein